MKTGAVFRSCFLQNCHRIVLLFCRDPAILSISYHQLTRANTLFGGKNNRWHCHHPRLAPASLRPLPRQCPFFHAGKSFGVFREGKRRHGEADEAAGLTPGNEENEVMRCFRSEKPYLSLSTDGIFDRKDLFSYAAYHCAFPGASYDLLPGCLRPKGQRGHSGPGRRSRPGGDPGHLRRAGGAPAGPIPSRPPPSTGAPWTA